MRSGIGVQRQSRSPVSNAHGRRDGPDLASRFLGLKPGAAQHFGEAAGRAVEAGQFRRVQLDDAVVDAEPGQGCKHVLDQLDLAR